MPTLPSGQPSSSGDQPHHHRQVAESFGVDAARYDRARPRYPDALVRRVIDASPGSNVLNVGCGTGIEARQFQAAAQRVLGVEPDERMARFARRHGVDVEVATFEAWDPAGRVFDAVIAGQSWHWVDPLQGATKAARVLRPAGQLAVFWNVFAVPSTVAEAFDEVYQRVVADSPFARRVALRDTTAHQHLGDQAADGIRRAAAFTEPHQWRVDWEQTYTRDQWLDLLPTTGGLTWLSADQRAEVLAGVGAAIDALGGSFILPYVTVAVTAQRTAAVC